MGTGKKKQIEVQGTHITVLTMHGQDFISLTDMARKFGEDTLVYNWMRNRNSVEFLGLWERIHNPVCKGLEFETFCRQAGLNSFSLTA